MEVPIHSEIQDSLGFPKCNGPKKTSYHHFVNTTYDHLKSTGNSDLHCSFINLPYLLYMCNIVSHQCLCTDSNSPLDWEQTPSFSYDSSQLLPLMSEVRLCQHHFHAVEAIP